MLEHDADNAMDKRVVTERVVQDIFFGACADDLRGRISTMGNGEKSPSLSAGAYFRDVSMCRCYVVYALCMHRRIIAYLPVSEGYFLPGLYFLVFVEGQRVKYRAFR